MNNFTANAESTQLAETEEIEPGQSGSSRSAIEVLPRKLQRFAQGRQRAKAMSDYLGVRLSSPEKDSTFEEAEARACRERLCDCGEWLHFRHYYTVDELRLLGGNFCQLPKLCPLCAVRRASKQLARYLERFESVRAAEPSLRPFLVTLTVKNGPDLAERFEHLQKAVRRLVDRRRQSRSGNGRGKTEFRKVHSMVGCYEVTERGKGWHPHFHAICLCESAITHSELSQEWQRSTKDSFIVDVRPMDCSSPEAAVKAFSEVFKYTLKFQGLDLPKNWKAHCALKRKRLLVGVGGFFGVPEDVTQDEELDQELPYVDMFFRYLDASGVYTYDHDRERTGIEERRGKAAERLHEVESGGLQLAALAK